MSEKTEKLAQQLADALVEEGRDRTTVEVVLGHLQPSVNNVVGNLADLQRMGGQMATQSGGVADNFVMPDSSTIEYEPTSADAPVGTTKVAAKEG